MLSALSAAEQPTNLPAIVTRTPWYCAGCPHNSSTKLPDGEIAVAAANVMVPLETLLTKNFRFAFSDKIVKEFEYSFCNRNGCLVRMGLLEEDITAMKKVSSSQLSITHISRPEATINLSLSLDGFTAAFDALKPF